MTIKELAAILKPDQKLMLENGKAYVEEMDHTDPLFLQAYGDFIIAGISARDHNEIEITLKMQFVKA